MAADSPTGPDEAAFQALRGEWCSSEQAAIGAWESQLTAMLEEQRALAARGDWVGGPSDLLSILGRSRQETYHSAVVAWLLWPSARHGLGTSLLRATLERCSAPGEDLSEERLAACSTFTEVTAAQSRADIIVEGPGLKVVVEVKVDAQEGYRQCQRLFDDHHADEALFVFLTPAGRAPQSIEPGHADAWKTWSFSQLRADLERCLAGATPNTEGARATARSYLETLTKEFS